jgi:hypothetical protein
MLLQLLLETSLPDSHISALSIASCWKELIKFLGVLFVCFEIRFCYIPQADLKLSILLPHPLKMPGL